jgi:sulfotransferase
VRSNVVSKIHFISGLPRAGSTLLSALLLQNPRFSAAMTSPVATLCRALHGQMCGGEFEVFFDDARRRTLLRSVFDAYYKDLPPEHVVFDTNRTWTGKAALLEELYPGTRIICCVREVALVIDSLERMLNRNPLQLSRIFNFQPGNSVYSRAETLMNAETGLIGRAMSNFREAWFGEFARMLVVIPYETLAREPKRTMQRLYEELGEAPFEHDFQNVRYDKPDYDASIGMPGLHTIREKVEYVERPSILPPDILTRLAAADFWKQPKLNVRGVKIFQPAGT